MKRNIIITPITFNVLTLFQKFHGVSKFVRNIANSASSNLKTPNLKHYLILLPSFTFLFGSK